MLKKNTEVLSLTYSFFLSVPEEPSFIRHLKCCNIQTLTFPASESTTGDEISLKYIFPANISSLIDPKTTSR